MLKILTTGAICLLGSALLAQSNADRLRAHYEQAETAQRAGHAQEAAQQYRLFLADALGELAIDRAHLGDYTRAAPLFDEALALAPHSPVLQVEYAQAAFAAGDFSRARSVAGEILSTDADNPKALAHAHFVLGRVAFAQNDSHEARAQFSAANQLDPTFAHGYALAIACLELQDHPCATQIFAELVKNYGGTATIHMDIGRAYGESNFEPDAIAEFRRVLAQDAHFPGAHDALAAALLGANGDSNLDAARAELQQELMLAPDEPFALASMGHIEALEHHDDLARQHLERATQIDPTSADAFFYLGELDVNDRRIDDAEAALRASIRLAAGAPQQHDQLRRAHYLLGRVLEQRGRAEEARGEMQTAQQLAQDALAQDQARMSALLGTENSVSETASPTAPTTPTSGPPVSPEAIRQTDDFQSRLAAPVADSYNNLGAIAAANQDFGFAATCFQRAAEWNASLPGLDENWGRAAFYAGRFSDAISPLSRVVAKDPGNVHMRAGLGVSQFEAGDFAAAVRTLEPIRGQLATMPAAQHAYQAALAKTSPQRAPGTH